LTSVPDIVFLCLLSDLSLCYHFALMKAKKTLTNILKYYSILDCGKYSMTGKKMKREENDLLIRNIGQLLTIPANGKPVVNPTTSSLGIIKNAYITVKNGKIKNVGTNPAHLSAKKVINAKKKTVLPGFIDSHTHLIFAGTREHEFSMRLAGKDYLAIMKDGGGIKSTVSKTRKTSKEQLFIGAKKYLDEALQWGTTTCEVKSGYGLSTSEEIKILEVAQMLQKEHPVDIIPTFLGAHDVPVEYNGKKKDYVELVKDEMIPEVRKRKLARFCDVFCEKGVFSKKESESILLSGLKNGMSTKIHAEEFTNIGGSELALKVKATSCDHLLYTLDAGLKSIKKAGTIAVLLPGTNLYLKKRKIPPVKKMRKYKIPIAIATDFNPGSCPVVSMPVMLSLACMLYGLTTEESIVGSTINAAFAVKEENSRGSIEKGKLADIIVTDLEDYRAIPYWFAQNHISYVIKRGKIVVS